MEQKDLLDILIQASKLKITTRHCNTQGERKESVADHSWRAALFAMLLDGETEFQNADINKVIKMCLIHDLGESFTGDIPTFEKTDDDAKQENCLYKGWINKFPEPQKSQWTSLVNEMEKQQSVEAKIYKAIDKLEAVISHNESDISTWLPLEYNLQFSYGRENVEFSVYFKGLKELIDEWTTEKINKKSG